MNSWLLELWAAPAALGFALLFNVPARSLLACCTLAVLGHALRKGVVDMGGDLALGSLIGGMAIGFAAQWWAVRHRMIPTVYSICAAIPMVPGTPMYKAMQALLSIASLPQASSAVAHDMAQRLLIEAGTNGVKACMILMALTFGIAAPILFMPHRRD